MTNKGGRAYVFTYTTTYCSGGKFRWNSWIMLVVIDCSTRVATRVTRITRRDFCGLRPVWRFSAKPIGGVASARDLPVLFTIRATAGRILSATRNSSFMLFVTDVTAKWNTTGGGNGRSKRHS